MKKKIVRVSLLVLIILLCSACNGTVTRELRHNGFSIGNKFLCETFYSKDSSKKVKYLTDKNIIDEDGKIYEVSLGQVYENKENCKVASTSVTVKAIFDDKIIKGNDNKYYYLQSGNNVDSYSMVPTTDNSYELYNILLKDDDIVKVITADSSKGVYYILKEDGNVYSYTINKENYNSPLKVVSRSIVYDEIDYGAKIVDFNYAGQTSSTYIKTEESVYRMKATNYDRCSKYADVSCIYSIEKDEVLGKYKDKIIAYNGGVLITDYNQIFNASN